MRAGVVAAVVLAATGCSPRALVADALIETAGTLAVDDGIAGMIIGVEQHGVRRVRAFGRARLAPDVAMRADAPFEIGSITKQLTAALVLQLVDAGKLRLDARVGELLPSAPPAARDVTVAQLLSHTGGVPDYEDADAHKLAAASSADEELSLVRDWPLRFAPGTRYAYSNSGYLLLGAIVARVGGAPWEAQVAARLTRPLGLASTRVCGPPDADPRRPWAYAFGGKPRPPARYFPAADGSLCATADDLLTWARALDGGRVVSPASYARMTTPARVAAGTSDYGFGLHIARRDGHRVLFHPGRVHWFASELERWPDDDVTVVVLQNTPSNRGDHVAMELGAALVDGPDRLFLMRMAWVYRRALLALLLAAIVAVVAWRRRARATVRG